MPGQRRARRLETAAIAAAASLLALLGWLLVAAVTGLPAFASLGVLLRGSFGSGFALRQTFEAATPLLLTGLAVALPARAGLLVIGAEGAFVISALAAAVAAAWLDGWAALPLLLGAGVLAGAAWLGICGWLKSARGVHEAVSSLLLAYVAVALVSHLVEGVLRDPASFDRPTTAPISVDAQLGSWEGLHAGLPLGLLACLLAYAAVSHSRWGFGLRLAGANPAAARFAGIDVGRLTIAMCVLSGALAGLAGALQVGAVAHSAGPALALGYGYAGILVAMIARGDMRAVIAAAVLVGALEAGGGALQRELGAPAASAKMMEGLLFIAIVVCGCARGPLARWLLAREARR
ncbi:MAG: ABC transporter permease [Betaproteobacteria bacterium AqS2]|uniref:ABC transporter permease n=1 Tax=Candidatus Amphirhobacter heronislandensis TaxID=1732024 RepID=A0A930XWZ0_9GAMM|nr:ABC transporter permease [Betaproteobacteria bacterium AqS2]